MTSDPEFSELNTYLNFKNRDKNSEDFLTTTILFYWAENWNNCHSIIIDD